MHFLPTPKSSALPQRQVGFSLVELMVTVAIIGIIAAIAAPNINSTLQSQRNQSAAQAIVLALKEARVESLLRRQDINVSVADTTIRVTASGTPLKVYNTPTQAPIAASVATTPTFFANKTARQTTYTVYCDADKTKAGRQVVLDVNGNVSIQMGGSQC